MSSLFIPLAGGSIVQVFSNLGNELQGAVPAISGAATFIAAVAAVFNLVIITAKIMTGEKVGLMALFKPFLMLIVIASFHTFVIAPLNYVTGAMCNSVNSVAASVSTVNFASLSEMKAKYEGLKRQMDSTYTAKTNSELGEENEQMEKFSSQKDTVTFHADEAAVTNGSLKQALTDFRKELVPVGVKAKARFESFFSDFAGMSMNCFMTMTVTVCEWIFPVVVSGYLCFTHIYLAILAMLGPLCFAFSLIPGIQSRPMSWVARYIEVSAWQPCACIVYLAYTKAVQGLGLDRFSTYSDFGPNVSGGGFAELEMAFLSVIVITFVCFVLLKNVKSMASVIMNAGGMGSINLGGAAIGGARRLIGI